MIFLFVACGLFVFTSVLGCCWLLLFVAHCDVWFRRLFVLMFFCCLVVVGCLLFVCCLWFVVRCLVCVASSLRVAFCLLFVGDGSLHVVRCSMFVCCLTCAVNVRCSVFVVGRWLLIVVGG